MKTSIIYDTDEYFVNIPIENHKEQLTQLQLSIQNEQFYQEILKQSTISKLSDRTLISLIITVIYELDSQFAINSINGKLIRYTEMYENEEENNFNNKNDFITRNRYICKIEGINDSSIPSLCKERNERTRKENEEININTLICVMSFEDSIELKIGERYHIIGIYQSSRFDEDNELDIKIPTNQRLFILLYRKYHLKDWCLDNNKYPLKMNINLEKNINLINNQKIEYSNYLIRNKILELLNMIIPSPMNIHLLLNLISNVKCRQPMIVHKYSLGLIVDNITIFVNNLKEILKIFNPFVESINYTSKKSLLPIISPQTVEYEIYPLQIGNDSIVIIYSDKEIDEINKEIIIELLNQYNLKYTIYGYDVFIPIKSSLIFVTKKDCNKEILLNCDQIITIHQGINNINIHSIISSLQFNEIKEIRNYITSCKEIDCSIDEKMSEIITNNFVNARQLNSTIDQMTLHKWITMSSLLGSSYGLNQLTIDIWNETMKLQSLN